MKKPLLSILIPSLPERWPKLDRLLERLQQSPFYDEAELLVLTDNRRLMTGEKRNILMKAATGQFIVHLDDDDMVKPDFLEEVLLEIERTNMYCVPLDLICYDNESYLDGADPFIVRTSLKFENEQVRKGPDGKYVNITRKPWHWCAWRRTLAIQYEFASTCVDEDWSWLRQVIHAAKSESKIDKVLHEYHFSSTETLSARGEQSTDGKGL